MFSDLPTHPNVILTQTPAIYYLCLNSEFLPIVLKSHSRSIVIFSFRYFLTSTCGIMVCIVHSIITFYYLNHFFCSCPNCLAWVLPDAPLFLLNRFRFSWINIISLQILVKLVFFFQISASWLGAFSFCLLLTSICSSFLSRWAGIDLSFSFCP